MIYLLGGAPRVGKSIIGRELAKATEFDYVSTDDVTEKALAAISKERQAILFPGPNFFRNPEENILSPMERTTLLMISNGSLRPDIDAIVRNAIAEHKNLVVEGAHLLASHARELEDEFGSEQVRSLFVGWKDVDAIGNGIHQDTGDRNWLKHGSPAVVQQVAEFVAAYSTRLQSDAEQHNVTYRERTPNFSADTECVLEYFNR